MAARGHWARAKQACISCKTRKKRCDRAFPSCSYCILKDLDCHYIPARRGHSHAVALTAGGSSHAAIRRDALPPGGIYDPTPPEQTLSEPPGARIKLYRPLLESLNGIHLEVQNIIRSTGEFVDDITARYFQNVHPHLPIISRTRFQSSLIASGGLPRPESAVLLLSICLIAHVPTVEPLLEGGEMAAVSRHSLYLATKAILAQAQGSLLPSVPLIQATLLLAIYEYATGRPEAAFTTIAACARMAYATRIHDSSRRDTNLERRLEAEEATNTWWGIIIYERAFFCEVGAADQPLMTTSPSADARLPVERDILDRADILGPESIPSIPVSSLTSMLGGFGRVAQASCLVDQVIRGRNIVDLDSRLLALQGLDSAIQEFLALVLSHPRGKAGDYCGAIAVAVCGLFALHKHILDLPKQAVSARLQSLEEWQKTSLAALDTVTIMIIDIAECHGSNITPASIISIPPNHIFIICAAMKHMRMRCCDGGAPWPESAEGRLRLYLENFCHHWGAVYD
ncbi:hypothetical protein GQ53DRAFT_699301 [Thozetella sp. PMI_491]|nr:hypothetical protein GQ53DRAFT_699301 [Thozetella sp. PMI_491]